MKKWFFVVLSLCVFSTASTQKVYKGVDILKDTTRTNPSLDAIRPIALQKHLMMKEMTWMEIRDLIKEGYTTAIVGTGGIEMNGPYMVTDKHNIITENLARGIAKKLGNTLVATVIPYVPEGDLNGPTGHVRYPGTLGVTEETFRALLTDIVTSLEHSGFKEIILIGDSGGNQKGLQVVSNQLNGKWKGEPVVRYIPEYFGYEKWIQFQEQYGIFETSEGIHDIFRDSGLLLLDDPNHIRKEERLEKGLFSINGIDLSDTQAIKEVASALFEHQVFITVSAIQEARKGK